jgi:hypothetical protein
MIDELQGHYGYVVYAVLSVTRPEDEAFIEKELKDTAVPQITAYPSFFSLYPHTRTQTGTRNLVKAFAFLTRSAVTSAVTDKEYGSLQSDGKPTTLTF